MEDFIYSAYTKYFKFLEVNGYYSYKDVEKLLVLTFIYDLLYNDYRGYVKKEDYQVFERALECLYGTSCLIPYTDYLKMGKLKLGEMTEVLHRTREVEHRVEDLGHAVLSNRRHIAWNTDKVVEHELKLTDLAKDA